MIYYFIHNFLNLFSYTSEWKESRKHCLNFIFGSTFYVTLFVFLQYLTKTTQHLFIELITKFFPLFVIIDALGMAIIYKIYWGRSILSEIDATREYNWTFDKKKHKYYKKDILRNEKKKKKIEKELMNYYNKSDHIDELKEKTNDLDKQTKELRNKTDELETALLYHPDGQIAKELEKDFYENANKQI